MSDNDPRALIEEISRALQRCMDILAGRGDDLEAARVQVALQMAAEGLAHALEQLERQQRE
jgi:hypothetical protein